MSVRRELSPCTRRGPATLCYAHSMIVDEASIFLFKAEESLAGAASELVNGRYNNCANRCYYACFQAAIAALMHHDIRPQGDEWSHAFVQSRFVGQLINRRKRYPVALRETLSRTLVLRERADYRLASISYEQATRALGQTRVFVEAIQVIRGVQP